MVAAVVALIVLCAALAAYYYVRKRSAPDIDEPLPRASLAPAPSSLDPHAPVAWLVGVGGGVDGKRFRIGTRTITVGRAPTNAVQVVDQKVSRKHCQLKPMGDWVQVTDMKSETGTMLNGARIEVATARQGDELCVGVARFQISFEAAAGADSALGAKVASEATAKSTIGNSSDNMASEVKAALAAAGGDVDKAAASLGLAPDALRGLLTFLDVEKKS